MNFPATELGWGPAIAPGTDLGRKPRHFTFHVYHPRYVKDPRFILSAGNVKYSPALDIASRV